MSAQPPGIEERTMVAESLLELLAEIAVALAGFTGVVATLSHRPGTGWTGIEALRFLNMLWASLLALVLSIAPLALSYAGIEERTVWRTCSILMLLSLLALCIWSIRAISSPEIRHDGGFNRWVSRGIFLLISVTIVFQALNASNAFERVSAAYVAGLVALIVLCILMFARMLVAVVRGPGPG